LKINILHPPLVLYSVVKALVVCYFYRAMLYRARLCYGKSSVCSSVCLCTLIIWLRKKFENNYTNISLEISLVDGDLLRLIIVKFQMK